MGDSSQATPARSARRGPHWYSAPPETIQLLRHSNGSWVGVPGATALVTTGIAPSRDHSVHSTVPSRVNESVIFWRTLAVTEAGNGTVALKPTEAAGKPTGINPNGGRTTGATNDGRKMSPWSL